MKKFLPVLLIIMLAGFTAGFESDLHSINQVSSPTESPQFNLEVRNNGPSEETYSIHVHEYHRSNWYRYDNRITLDPNKAKNVSINVNPSSDAIAQSYGFEVSVRPINAEKGVRHSGSFKIIRENGLNIKKIGLSSSYKPSETMPISIVFQNVDPTTSEYKDIRITAIGQNLTEELGPVVPGGERQITQELKVPQYESPGEKKLSVSFDGRTYTEKFNVESVENVTTQKNIENRLVTVKQTFKASNHGNQNESYSYDVVKPSYIAPVVSAPNAQVTETENGVKYSWKMQLAPGETKNVELNTDYWKPLTGLIVLLGVFVGLKKVTSSVSTKKTVTRTSEGLDIRIEVENNSSKTFDDVLLEDYIPNIAELDSSFEMASPEINNTGNGTKLKWWLTELEPGDQRILKYSIRPKVEVEGGITLEPAVLKDGDKVLDRTNEIDTEFRPSE